MGKTLRHRKPWREKNGRWRKTKPLTQRKFYVLTQRGKKLGQQVEEISARLGSEEPVLMVDINWDAHIEATRPAIQELDHQNARAAALAHTIPVG